MRVYLILLVTCLVLLVVIEGSSSKSSTSKSPGSKSSVGDGKVTKVKAKPIRHRSSDSSESSEEHRHKHKKKHSDKFKSEERFDSRKGNSTKNRKIGSNLNSTRIFGGDHNSTGKYLLLTKNATFHELIKINNTNSTGLNENKTLIGWKIFTKPNISSVNETKNNVLDNFLHNEKGTKVVNGSYLHSNDNKWNSSVTPPAYGWKNINGTAPGEGWKNNPYSVQGWNIKPSAPDYRKEFSVSDQRKDQKNYFDSPGGVGYLQSNPNFISYPNQPVAFPAGPDYNRKNISNIAPEYGWGVPQPSYINNDQHNTDREIFNNYPINKNYGSSEESSSKIAKGAKKLLKKLGKGTGEVLSSDQVKDAVKQAASSYFANPPPDGWIYNPPYSNTKQTFYGRFSKPVGKESLSADDWRSIIFGNVPTKVETRNLYSAAFPVSYQNLDLNAFSEKGNLPNFNQTQYKAYFTRPFYQKLFAGLQNEEINEHFRAKRELSEKGKTMADVINKFFLHERNCNDTELNARRKRNLMIRPLAKNAGSKNEEKRVTDFPFSGVEAIVQSDYGISVYEEAPKEIQLDNSTENEENTTPNVKGSGENSISTAEPVAPISRKRTKLYPVSETIEQFLNKKPPTRLTVIDESLEKWKSKARIESNTFTTQRSEVINSNDHKVNSTKRIARSRNTSDERDHTPFYRWITDLRYSDSDVTTPYVTQHYREAMEESKSAVDSLLNDREIISNTPRMFLQDSIEQFSSPTLNSEENTQEEETSPRTSYDSEESSRKNGFYFFGAYINDYNNQKWENHVSNSSDESALEKTDISSTTPLPNLSTEHSDIRTPLMESTTAVPALGYSNHGELTTENIKAISEPTFPEPASNAWMLDNANSKPSDSSVYVPFKIHSISTIRYIHSATKERRNTQKNNSEPVDGTLLIQAPLISNRCGRNQRMVKGRCRTIW